METRLGPVQRTIAAWGMWPAMVMVLSQWEAFRLSARPYSWQLAGLTAAGTLSVYGADRLVERLTLAVTEERHRAGSSDGLMMVSILALGLPGLLLLDRHLLIWLGILGFAGLVYLAVTSGKIRVPVLIKELLGSFCFSVLVWGLVPGDGRAMTAFFAAGFANFLMASHGDRLRDEANHIHSLAVRFPTANLWLARLAASMAILLYLPKLEPLFWVAVLHAVWPSRYANKIDFAFLPLLLVPFLVFY